MSKFRCGTCNVFIAGPSKVYAYSGVSDTPYCSEKCFLVAHPPKKKEKDNG